MGVWGISSSDVFAVGTGGTILHYENATWTAMASGSSASLRDIWGSSSSDVFVVGTGGTILHYDGVSWTPMSSGSGGDLQAVWGTSPGNVFAVGGSAGSGIILHYDGVTWTLMTTVWANLIAIWGSSSSDVYVVGAGGAILHYDGASWTPMSSGVAQNLCGIWGSSASDVFAAGDTGTILHYDGTAWTAMSSGSTNALCDIWGSSDTSVFAVGAGGTVLHYPEAVIVSSVSPSAGRAGETRNVVISGVCLNGATGVTFGNGVTVNSFTVDSPYRITANITITAETPGGARNVEVMTPRGVGRLSSGFTVREAVPAPAEESGSRMWIQWLVLGVVCAAVLGVAGYLLVRRRRKKGEKPPGAEKKRQPQEPVRKPEPVRPPEPIRPAEPVLTAQPLPEEEPIQQAASLASVSTLKARLASLGRDQGTGGAPPAKEEPLGETTDEAVKAGPVADASGPVPASVRKVEGKVQKPPASKRPAGQKPGIFSKVTATVKEEPRQPSGPIKPENEAQQPAGGPEGAASAGESASEASSDSQNGLSKTSYAEAARLRLAARQRADETDKPGSPSDGKS
jgi:hypothetical protein